MSFSIDITRFANKTKSTLDQSARAIKISLFNGVIRDTRVDTGRLRGNWMTTTGSPATGTVDRLDKIEQGTNGGEAMNEVISNVRGATVDYLTNSLPYAQIWEERDGMIQKNMSRISRIVQEVSRGRR
ncbi:MAG: hypothetical protein KIT59_00770 [Nitrosomonas sp.]|nr:hypothetical protein [Nitrosomonas sp.]